MRFRQVSGEGTFRGTFEEFPPDVSQCAHLSGQDLLSGGQLQRPGFPEPYARLPGCGILSQYLSKRRNFYTLRDFLQYLFIEGVIQEDLSVYIPKIKSTTRKKLPVYFKQEEIEEKLKEIPRERKIEKKNYAIILIAARLGLRISDILNIKLKDIDWEHHELHIIQQKTNHSNILPLPKDVGWAVIDYIQHARPKCENEYLFVKMRYPFEKMEQFHNFNKYFETEEIENTKKGIHNLRHSLAKNMLDNDIPLHTISSVLGHHSLETTSNTYLSIDEKHLKECSLEVEE